MCLYAALQARLNTEKIIYIRGALPLQDKYASFLEYSIGYCMLGIAQMLT